MGRGESKTSAKVTGKSAYIRDGETRSMVSERESADADKREAIDGFLSVGKSMRDKYGDAGIVENLDVATVRGKDGGNVMGYYDMNGNVGVNKKFLSNSKLNDAMDVAGKEGFHPSRGNKSGAEAVASHEYGHALTDAYAKATGAFNIDTASISIMIRAEASYRKSHPKSRASVETLIGRISGYAKESPAEMVAESVADVYCNGKKANPFSKAVVAELDSKLLK